MSTKLYVGAKIGPNTNREVFRSATTPTEKSHGAQYDYVIGPFRTKRAANIMRDRGNNNPHIQTVTQAERIGKRETERTRKMRIACASLPSSTLNNNLPKARRGTERQTMIDELNTRNPKRFTTTPHQASS